MSKDWLEEYQKYDADLAQNAVGLTWAAIGLIKCHQAHSRLQEAEAG
jgi:hypothetical protein